jgi:hypothetical protein
VDRPTRDDEHSRIQWWENILLSNNTKEDVARSAARALAMRDKRIADLERQLSSAHREADMKHGCSFCGSLTCRGGCIK